MGSLGVASHTVKKSLQILLLIVASLAARADGASSDSVVFTYYDGNRYEFRITEIQVERAPKWNPAKDPNPPLSAAAALTKAREFIATVPALKDCAWRLEALGLTYVFFDTGWVWRARYSLDDLHGSTGKANKMDCWILLDGTVIQPRITRDKSVTK